MMPIEDQFTKEDIRIGNRLALLEMISTGTTSYSDMYFHTDTAVENAVEAGIKANLCRPSQCFDKNETYEQNTRAKESIDLFKRCNGMAEGRILIDFAIHAEYTNFPHIVEAYKRRLQGPRRADAHSSLRDEEGARGVHCQIRQDPCAVVQRFGDV